MGQALSRSRLRSRSSEEVLDWCNTVISTTQAVAEYMGPRTTLVAVCDLNSDSGKREESGRERETGRRIYGASDVQQNLSYFLGIISSTAEGTSAANLLGGGRHSLPKPLRQTFNLPKKKSRCYLR